MLSDNNSKAKTVMSIILLLIATIFAMSCKECPTEPKYDIYLSVEDVACVWVTLNVTLPDSGRINTFALERNDSTVATYTCNDEDTLIIDEGLTPDTDYIYRVRFLKDGKTKSESDPVSVHTLDTTSHDFTWEIDTLGNYGSYLKDAWIVDENNIWVVGEIIVPDTDSSWNGTGFETFNAAHWDGSHWNLSRFERGVPLNSIWYFDENDIWAAGIPIHWDGEKWDFYHLWDMGILDDNDGGVEHIWASSPADIYFVGRKGSIVHYDGSSFTKIESGTNLSIKDIWGSYNSETRQWEILAIACEIDVDRGNIILKINGTNVTAVLSDGLPWYLQGIWFIPNRRYYICGDGLYSVRSLGQIWQKIPNLPLYSKTDIDGLDVNDIMVVGSYGLFLHYNGNTWHHYEDKMMNGCFSSVKMKDQMVIAVGYNDNSAVVVRGYR